MGELSNNVEPAILRNGQDFQLLKGYPEVAVQKNRSHHHHKGFAGAGNANCDCARGRYDNRLPLLIGRKVILA